jgi:HTH-type transcriptional regulator, competence development regulator
MGFGTFVRVRRQEKGISLNEFSRRLDISPAYWSRIEREVEKAPKDELIQKAAELLEVPRDEMFIQAERFPPEMKRDVAFALQAYRRAAKKDRR